MFQLLAVQFSHKPKRHTNDVLIARNSGQNMLLIVSAHKRHLKVSSDRLAREDQAPIP
jgi:hypothetical protein